MFISKGMTESEAQAQDDKDQAQAQITRDQKKAVINNIRHIRPQMSPEFAYVKQLFHGFKYKRVPGSTDIVVFKLALCCGKKDEKHFCCRPIAMNKYTICLQLPLTDAELGLAKLETYSGEIPMEGIVNDILHETQCIICWNKYINLLKG
jgi:hypothetical protein